MGEADSPEQRIWREQWLSRPEEPWYHVILISHKQLCDAVNAALELETDAVQALHGGAVARWRWLNEAELVARLRGHLVRVRGVNSALVRVGGPGRCQEGGSNHDLELGIGDDRDAIEVVYCVAAKARNELQPQQAEYLNADLEWLVARTGLAHKHVVAFFPRMHSGYSVQRHERPYGLDHRPFDLPTDRRLLTGCIQATSFSNLTQAAVEGVFARVVNPAHGRTVRWSLAANPDQRTKQMTLNRSSVTRSCIRNCDEPLWAIAWSRATG